MAHAKAPWVMERNHGLKSFGLGELNQACSQFDNIMKMYNIRLT
jgi:hypothetical protein